MISNWLSIGVGFLYVALMWYSDSAKSALALCLPLAIVIIFIWKAESLAAYTGWAGRASITFGSPAGKVRAFAWCVLVIPGIVILCRKLLY